MSASSKNIILSKGTDANTKTGEIQFFSQTDNNGIGKISFNHDATPANRFLKFSLDSSAGDMIIKGGNVGIGVSPDYRLQFANTVQSKICLYGDSSHMYGFGISEGQLNYHVYSTLDRHVFYAEGTNGNGTELMRIQGNGNVGIGTTTPISTLDVDGNVRIGTTIGTDVVASGRLVVASNNSSTTDIEFRTDDSTVNSFDYPTAKIVAGFTGTAYNTAFLSFKTHQGNTSAFTEDMYVQGGHVVIPAGNLTVFDNWNIASIYVGQRFGQNQYVEFTMAGGGTPHILFKANAKTYTINVDVDHGSSTLNFTGQHRVFITEYSLNELYNLRGLIVCANKNSYTQMYPNLCKGNKAIDIDESLPEVSLCNKDYDKSVFGVISNNEEHIQEREEGIGKLKEKLKKEEGDDRTYINSLGEGAIWVSDKNGNLESGDYITSCTIPGYGMKQNSEFLANYTVAKITMDCDFNPVTQPVPQIFKDTNGNNILDTNGFLQWVNHATDTEKAYNIRHILADGTQITESDYNTRKSNGETVYKAAFVGCTYHCG